MNESGDLVEFVGTTMDVTEQVQTRTALEKALQEIKQRNEDLRASEHNLNLIINTIPALVWSASLPWTRAALSIAADVHFLSHR